MNMVLWVGQWLIGVAFLVVGARKLAVPFDKLAQDERMAWAARVGPTPTRIAGLSEAAGGLGLVLPGLTGIGAWLTPLAGLGLAAVMLIAAVWVHRPHNETQAIVATTVLGLLALGLAVGRVYEPLT